jgi:hypothetical protein
VRIAAGLIVFHLVCLAWLFFRADDFDTATVYLQGLAALTPGIAQITPFTASILLISLSLHLVPRDIQGRLATLIRAWPTWALGTAGGAAIAAINAAGPDGVAPFIYFQF